VAAAAGLSLSAAVAAAAGIVVSGIKQARGLPANERKKAYCEGGFFSGENSAAPAESLLLSKKTRAMVLTDEAISFEEMKALYPEEWVVVGDPEYDEFDDLIGGVVLMHDKDKRKMAYQAQDLVKSWETFAVIYTGEFPKNRKYWL
jgi:hypothetical protein